MKYAFLLLATLLLQSGCSTKEINSTVDSVTSDVVNAFENSKDKSNQ